MIPKVCSYRRSGTHLIMATIYHNFDVGGQSKKCHVYDWKWAGTGETEVVIPWAGLFGNHKSFSKCGITRKRIIYGIRHPLDALVSYWRMPASPYKEEYCPLDKWIIKKRIRSWVNHVEGYILEGQCFWIRFEDLVGPEDVFASVLDGIEDNFGLAPLKTSWSRVEDRVSWLPNKSKPKVPNKLVNRVNNNISDDLMDLLGYSKKTKYEDYSVIQSEGME